MPRQKKFKGPVESLTVQIPKAIVGEMSERIVALRLTKAQAVAWGLERWLEQARDVGSGSIPFSTFLMDKVERIDSRKKQPGK